MEYTHRLFISQDTLDNWMVSERVDVEGDVMTMLPEGHRFRLLSGVHFLAEVAGGGDAEGLIGKVKDLEKLAAMGGEHFSDSVLLEDSAYQVVEGFIGEPLLSKEVPKGRDLASAARAALGEGEPPSEEVDLLARFFAGGS